MSVIKPVKVRTASLPVLGAWIEILSPGDDPRDRQVAPCVGIINLNGQILHGFL